MTIMFKTNTNTIMTSNITFSSASLFFPTTGSDTTRVGIYRGDLTTATLVGQTSSSAPTSNYYTRAITLVTGSLSFVIGNQIVVAYSSNGSTSAIVTTTGVSNIALATLSGTGYATAGFPSLISGVATQAATTMRMCLDLL